ncbi:amino acid ABC transporter permease [Fusobacterium necrophorum subsp. funduliforme]|uniref:Amino acid ABC transporter permease n=2 Tax=Fusobacterium necrophorum subsp. funduliforme TaxID=143387 RepID=A0A162J5C6_9FUSO|nr:amino acid ABC transporter permease [Fusobacterium necrophorum]EYD68920.1 PAAT family amino acid ABC transporter membrane protein [Fusobacterium necrophorum subsp. funduliforme B35]KID49707.1 amino acid ABC transporter permease [Fusobacterium necrophorum subsp. funduliforme B35]KYL01374.1 amino acid ABC transporter permease [Fusobacterium necrophorum subsp. funduliforme]KYL03728.1 amino acid ABC transporter permease [Fusobacterium necrophorum subsp. funduliforme]KYL05169.1 amino acid ABC tr
MVEYLQTLQDIFLAEDRYLYILNGLGFSVGVTLFAAILGILLGILLALLKLSQSKFLSQIALLYIDIVRGTPAVVQLMILANIVFVGALRETPILLVAGIAFGMNSGAYVAEIIRAGIEGLEKGQTEAGRALGLSYAQTMKFIIIPQAIKKILPALVSEFITLLKETSIVGFIGGVDLLRSANIITSQTYRGVEPLLAVGIIYLILTSIFTILMRKVEKGLKVSD